MKKLISLLATSILTFAMASVSHAQTFWSGSFLSATSIQVSNTFGITNLTSISTHYTTNINKTVYTNLAGNQVITGASTNDYYNLLKKLPLWADRNGSPYIPIFALTNFSGSSATNASVQAGPYYGNIFIRIAGHNAAANSAVTFLFAVVPSGGADSLASGDQFTISVTASGTTQVCSRTPLDLQRVASCKELMLIGVKNGDADADSEVVVLECSLNGFIP